MLYSVIHASFSHYMAQPEPKKILNQLDIGTGNMQLEKMALLRSTRGAVTPPGYAFMDRFSEKFQPGEIGCTKAR